MYHPKSVFMPCSCWAFYRWWSGWLLCCTLPHSALNSGPVHSKVVFLWCKILAFVIHRYCFMYLIKWMVNYFAFALLVHAIYEMFSFLVLFIFCCCSELACRFRALRGSRLKLSHYIPAPGIKFSHYRFVLGYLLCGFIYVFCLIDLNWWRATYAWEQWAASYYVCLSLRFHSNWTWFSNFSLHFFVLEC